eukprot:5252263-Pyramimonas_sp.AAC.1
MTDHNEAYTHKIPENIETIHGQLLPRPGTRTPWRGRGTERRAGSPGQLGRCSRDEKNWPGEVAVSKSPWAMQLGRAAEERAHSSAELI